MLLGTAEPDASQQFRRLRRDVGRMSMKTEGFGHEDTASIDLETAGNASFLTQLPKEL
jgi:hypothetical protein